MLLSTFLVVLLLLFLLIETVFALKFLAYNPIFGHSHANFIGKVADTLADAGHEVVMLSQVTHTRYRNVTSERARVILVAGNDFSKQFTRIQDETMSESLWKGSQRNSYTFVQIFRIETPYFAEMCRDVLNAPGLLDQLRAEKFDGAFSEYSAARLISLEDTDKRL